MAKNIKIEKDVITAINIGLGLLNMTKRKAEKLAKQIKSRKINPKQGEKIISDLIRQSSVQAKKAQQLVNRQIKKALDLAGIATKKDLEKLKNQLKKRK